jgi:hypothetical protein
MAAFEVIIYGRFWVITEVSIPQCRLSIILRHTLTLVICAT